MYFKLIAKLILLINKFLINPNFIKILPINNESRIIFKGGPGKKARNRNESWADLEFFSKGGTKDGGKMFWGADPIPTE